MQAICPPLVSFYLFPLDVREIPTKISQFKYLLTKKKKTFCDALKKTIDR